MKSLIIAITVLMSVSVFGADSNKQNTNTDMKQMQQNCMNMMNNKNMKQMHQNCMNMMNNNQKK